jgi:hypothetical protein
MKKTLFFMSAIIAGMFFGNTVKAQQSDDMVAVYRWYSPTDRDYITVAEGEYQEGQLLNWKYKDKTLLFYAFREPGPNRVAVYRWYNPVTKDVASIADDEFTTDDMLKMGYKDKKLQYYVPVRRGENRVAVYRWYIPKTKDWVTIPEEGDTDAYYKKGYRRKTFQYYGIKRREYSFPLFLWNRYEERACKYFQEETGNPGEQGAAPLFKGIPAG